MGFWRCMHCHKCNYISDEICSCGQTHKQNTEEAILAEKIKKEEKRKQKELRAIERVKRLLAKCDK